MLDLRGEQQLIIILLRFLNRNLPLYNQMTSIQKLIQQFENLAPATVEWQSLARAFDSKTKSISESELLRYFCAYVAACNIALHKHAYTYTQKHASMQDSTLSRTYIYARAHLCNRAHVHACILMLSRYEINIITMILTFKV